MAISTGAGTITLDTAQDIRTTASQTFTGLAVSGVASSLLKTTGSGELAAAGTSDVASALGFTPVNKAGDTLSGGLSVTALSERGAVVPAISALGQGVIYFDSATAQFKVSQNGSAYRPPR